MLRRHQPRNVLNIDSLAREERSLNEAEKLAVRALELSPNSTWLVTSRLGTARHDTIDVSSVSNRAVRQTRHSQNARVRHVERVVSRRDVSRQVESGLWLLKLAPRLFCISYDVSLVCSACD